MSAQRLGELNAKAVELMAANGWQSLTAAGPPAAGPLAGHLAHAEPPREGLQGIRDGLGSLGPDGGLQIRGTLGLLLGSAIVGTLIGTANGWLLINCRFPTSPAASLS